MKVTVRLSENEDGVVYTSDDVAQVCYEYCRDIMAFGSPMFSVIPITIVDSSGFISGCIVESKSDLPLRQVIIEQLNLYQEDVTLG